eukprot:gene8679-10192_t
MKGEIYKIVQSRIVKNIMPMSKQEQNPQNNNPQHPLS